MADTALDTRLNAQVQAILDEEVACGAEIGLQAAIYHRGKLVADAWAGTADVAASRPVDGDTLFTAFSTTKGIAATCLHIAAEQGKVAYDAPVATYWPEFGAAGKGAITVRQVLCHMAGMAPLPFGVTVEMMIDWAAMTTALAAMAPAWVPGTASGYHALTFGWLVGEIVHRADGRPFGQFVQEELCAPLGITGLYMGIPETAAPRVATLVNGNFPPPAPGSPPPTPLSLATTPSEILGVQIWNRADVRSACIPGAGGIMNARSIGRHYALLAGWGELDGVRLLSRARVEAMRSLQTAAIDLNIGRVIYKGMGYFCGGPGNDGYELALGARPTTFGHPGHGGFIGWADPELGLAVGFTKTLLNNYVDSRRNPVYQVSELARNFGL